MVRAKRLRGGRRTAARPRKNSRALHPATFIVASVLIAALILGVRGIYLAGNSAGFAQGVWVNGTSLGGYSYEDGKQLIENQVYERLNVTEYQITYADNQWTFTAGDLGAAMDVSGQIDLAWNFGHTGGYWQRREQMQYLKSTPMYFDAEVHYDEAKLDQYIEEIRAQIDTDAVDSTTVMDENAGEFVVVRSKEGRKLNTTGLKAALIDAIEYGTNPVINLSEQGYVETVQPTTSTEDVADGLELIAEARTSFKGSTENRIKNIKRALSCFDNLELKSGQTVYFSEKTGKRTKANGYYEANEYVDGQVVAGFGGGTCQVSTTLYQALLKADVFIEQRHNHGMTVDYTEPSLDAAVWEGKKDLVFTNIKSTPIYIRTSVEGNYAVVRIYGKPLTHTVDGQEIPCSIKLESVVTKTFGNTKKSSSNVKYDMTGKIATYTDDYVIAKEGKKGVNSYGVKIYCDESGTEIDRENLAGDHYQAQTNNYWRGIIDRNTGLPVVDATE